MRWLLLALCLPLAAAAMQPLEGREATPGPGATLLLLRPVAAATSPQAAEIATLVIIIDDLGYRLAEGEATIKLPGRFSVAVLPHTTHGRHLARQAHRAGKEVLLHAPMSALDQRPLGPGALTAELSEAEFRDTLQQALAGVPHAAGVNNHMGSELTGRRQQMEWLMTLLAEKNLYFVDSRTHKDSVASKVATEAGLPHLSRQVFLDNIPTREAIAERFAVLVARAQQEGVGVAIGHPYPETIAFLREVMPTLESQGLRLATVSEVLATLASEAAAP